MQPTQKNAGQTSVTKTTNGDDRPKINQIPLQGRSDSLLYHLRVH